MFQRFYPDEVARSAYEIDYEALYREGIRGLIYDIDNTLVEHGADADERAVALISRLREGGFSVCFLSNNKEPRVKRFNEPIGAAYLFQGKKPGRAGYERAMELLGTDRRTTAVIGDQLFTDIYGARRAGLKSILVKPIGKKEEIQIVLKRRLERIVLYFYNKKKRDRETE